MGKKSSKNRVKKHGGHLTFKKSIKVKRRGLDLDQIQDELQRPVVNRPFDPDLPGFGQHYCLTCARYFPTDGSLSVHMRSKIHKKKLKLALEPQYNQREAEAAAGMAPPA
jgi:bud site selection protein 20